MILKKSILSTTKYGPYKEHPSFTSMENMNLNFKNEIDSQPASNKKQIRFHPEAKLSPRQQKAKSRFTIKVDLPNRSINHSRQGSQGSLRLMSKGELTELKEKIIAKGSAKKENFRLVDILKKGGIEESSMKSVKSKKPTSVLQFLEMQNDEVSSESKPDPKEAKEISGDFYDAQGKKTNLAKFNQQMIDAEEERHFRREMRELKNQKNNMQLASAMSLISNKLSQEHNGQMQYFNLSLDPGEERLAVTLNVCNQLAEFRRTEQVQVTSFKKELEWKADAAIAYAKNSRVILRNKFTDWRRNRWIKLGNEAYKHQKLKCLCHLLRDMYLKFLAMNLDRMDVGTLY